MFSTRNAPARIGVALGDHVVDVAELLRDASFHAPSLNGFMARGLDAWRATRARIQEVLSATSPPDGATDAVHARAAVTMHLPFAVADYVDFYSSRQHAENVGRMFRPDQDPLPAAWLHLPIGYHGRAGTVVVSGTDIARPNGQGRDGDAVTFGPSTRLDIECEVGFVVGTGSQLGSQVSPDAFDEHVFGLVLVNDWSARDIQALEYVPLGPFLGKSFATSISAWVTPIEALRAARIAPSHQSPEPASYLRSRDPWTLDLELEVSLNGTVVSRPPFAPLYWRPAQQLAHLTSNGASLRTGDLFASGTVSGETRDQFGSLLELTWNGRDPIKIDGGERTFLEDGDEVVIGGHARTRDGRKLALGEVRGRIKPAR